MFVVRVRDGQIVESLDYADHIGLARALGRLEPLAWALEHDTSRAPVGPTKAQTSRGLVLRLHAAFNALDLPAVDEIFTSDFYSHPLQSRGAAVKKRWVAMRTAAPAPRTEVVDLIAETRPGMTRRRPATDRTAAGRSDGRRVDIGRAAEGFPGVEVGPAPVLGEPNRLDCVGAQGRCSGAASASRAATIASAALRGSPGWLPSIESTPVRVGPTVGS